MAAQHRISLRITGMSCDHCVMHVTKALQSVPGVVEVQVPGWESARAEVTAKADVPDTALVEAVQEAGYGAEIEARQPL